MPELPEVETTVRGLRPQVTGRRFTGVEVGIPRMVRAPSPEDLTEQLPGRAVTALGRRGKFILFRLDQGALVVHLMMGGALMWADPADEQYAGGKPIPVKHTRLRFFLDNEAELWLVNPRTLGGVWLVDDAEQVVSHLGPEPLDPEFTAEVLGTRLAGRSAPIKPLLLSQEVVAGIGNIYADESLFMAGIRPERPADEISDDELAELHRSIIAALEKGISMGGTSLGDFFDPFGTAGTHQGSVNVFRRNGKPCPRCGAIIEKKMFRGRGTHYCPSCQT